MNRPIKFRGRDVCTGEYAYGDLIQSPYNGKIVFELREPHKRHITGFDYHTVAPDTVAQLVGYDANGNEVYEGDTVLRYDSKEEFDEAPENGVLREVILYTQVNPDLESYYCIRKEQSA